MTDSMFSSVERRDHLGRDEFIRQYLRHNKPVVIGGAMAGWQAMSKWTTDFFRSEFGSLSVAISGDFFNPIKRMRLGEFIDLMPIYAKADKDKWDFEQPVPYLRLPCPETRPKAIESMIFERLKNDWTRPDFLPKFLYISPFELRGRQPNLREYPERSILISPRGSCTSLHVDRTNDSAILCQVFGEKVAFLFPPNQTSFERVREEWLARQAGTLRPKTKIAVELIYGKLPTYSDLLPLKAVLKAGDILFIPKRWPHEVFTISNSISLTYNFMHLIDLDVEYVKYRLAAIGSSVRSNWLAFGNTGSAGSLTS